MRGIRFGDERAETTLVRNGRRRPSISFTLSVIGVLLLVPFLGVSAAQWRAASEQVDRAHEVAESAQRLDVLLRIPAAIDNEMIVTGWSTASGQVFDEMPSAATFLKIDSFDSVDDAVAATDELFAQAEEPHLEQLLQQARVEAEAVGVVEMSEFFEPVIREAQTVASEELIKLNVAASSTGDVTITRYTRLAESISELQLNLVGMSGKWGSLESEKFYSPTANTVMEFNHRLVEFSEQTMQLEAAIPPDGPLRDRWTELNRSSELAVMLAAYEDTAKNLARDGTTVADDTSELDLSAIDFAEAVRLASKITTTFEAASKVEQLHANLLDATIEKIDSEASKAATRAEAQQRSTVFWLLGAASLFLVAVLGGALLIGRPVHRMATAARRLSEGDLDVQVPERGPREVQIGSRALNNALASLRTAEAQAVALAEERLDDPILGQRTPGNLGASLQTAVGRLAASIADRDRIQHELEYEASHDGLTKLANRRAVIQHLESSIARANRGEHFVALLFVDLDDFKAVNDSHGHYSGDRVLREIADRLEKVVRRGDLAGRLGGDEFVVVAEPIADIGEAVELAERVLERINQPVVIDGLTIVPGSSIGIGLSDGQLTADEILRDADLAVYRAKGAGKGRVHVCDEDLRREVSKHTELEGAIKRAMADDEFELYYQPTINTEDGGIALLEALVRWHHPSFGLTPPHAFIPTAENSDLITELDCWVLSAAGKQLEEWANDRETAARSVSVNISARHLGSGTLARSVANVLGEFEFNPQRLMLEITETALLQDIEVAASELSELRGFGVRIALDDFGTGYMSLANLRSLPVDVMKIDRSFVADLENAETRSLIKLIIDTGHLLNISVTAEGVETEYQVNEMRSLGADALQGFYFAKPMPAGELGAFVALGDHQLAA